jgi:hypothetical protein
MLGDDAHAVTVTARDWNAYSSTFPSEIVTCRVGKRAPQRVFCKYFLDDFGHSYGEFRYPFYEIEVYRSLLSRLSVSLPRFLGAWTEENQGAGMLVIESLDRGCRMTKTADPEGSLVEVARWAADFHRASAPEVAGPELAFLKRLDRRFFEDRLKRLLAMEESGPRYGWLRRLAGHIDRLWAAIADLRPTAVHGELYPQNVLFQEGRPRPVDWETTSVGLAEFDLATLLERWPRDVARRAIDAYLEAGCLAVSPRDLAHRLTVARVLTALHWLGIEPATPGGPRRFAEPWRFAQLRRSASRLGLI